MLRFRNLFREEPPKRTSEEVTPEAAPVPEPEEQTVPEPVLPPDPIPTEAPREKQYPIKPEGDLLAIWKRWKENDPPPVLSLDDDRGPEALHMDEEALEQERTRIGQKLERDAQLRQQLIHTIEAKEQNTAALAATCNCFVSRDKRAAWLFVFPPTAHGDQLLQEDVLRVLSRAGITTGIEEQQIHRALDPAHYFELIPIAMCVPALEGTDGTVIEHFPREVVRKVVIDENGNADYHAQTYVQIVAENDILCDIIPPTAGQDGKRVDGSVIRPKSVKAAWVPKGDGTKFSEDGLQLLAARDGQLEYKMERFYVHAVLDIEGDVDYSTGNIEFPGNVHITGDVREGFQIIADGAVMVDGLVEGATVTAGSDLVITQGVVGNYQAVLRCGGTLRTRYLENCTAYVGKCIYVDCAVNASLFCDETVSVVSGKGCLIGGSITAGCKIQAREIGSRSGRATKLALGGRPYLMDEEKDSAAKLNELKKVETSLDRKRYELEHLSGYMKPEEREKRLAEIAVPLQKARAEREQVEHYLDACGCTACNLDACGVTCETMYPITTILINGNVSIIDTERSPYRAFFDKHTGEWTESS